MGLGSLREKALDGPPSVHVEWPDSAQFKQSIEILLKGHPDFYQIYVMIWVQIGTQTDMYMVNPLARRTYQHRWVGLFDGPQVLGVVSLYPVIGFDLDGTPVWGERMATTRTLLPAGLVAAPTMGPSAIWVPRLPRASDEAQWNRGVAPLHDAPYRN